MLRAEIRFILPSGRVLDEGIFLHNGNVIGDVALQDVNWRDRTCTIGLGIAKIENWAKGYETEAVGLMLAYGFGNLGLERIAAHTLEHNKAAQRVLEKLGFVLEGTERKAVYFAGRRWDRLIYAILREEYYAKNCLS